MSWWPPYGAKQLTAAMVILGALIGFALGSWIWALVGLVIGWLVGAGLSPALSRLSRKPVDSAATREAFVRALVVRWEWRLVGSDEGRQPGKNAALSEQAQEELNAFIERERASLAGNAAAAKVAAEAARERVSEAASKVPPEPGEPAGPKAPTASSRFKLGIPMAALLTVAVVVLAVLATGAVVDLTASSTFVPLAAITVLSAVMGGVAGATLTWERTPWAIGIAASILVLGSVAAFLVAWVAGLVVERRLLLTVLFIMLATMSAAIWAFRALAAQPREVRSHERRERRRYKKALEQRNSRLAQLEAARAAQAEADKAEHRASIALESFDNVADAWRKELALVGQRVTVV